jgi:dTDP-4-dehydrorhamnose 3,5-epimerase
MLMPFRFRPLQIPDVILIEARAFGDDRGFFVETYRQSEFVANGIADHFVQDNYSFSLRGVLRGLHYQKHPQAQAKLVRAVQGEVFDVAVDIRAGSLTYGEWVGETLSAENGHMLYVPPGFAHGFCVLSSEAGLAYKVTAEYAPALERGIRWNDPQIGIRWPIQDPLLSERDEALPLLNEADHDFELES